MKETILNTFETEVNEETVRVTVVQTELGVRVDISGKTMDVAINDEVVYSKYEKEEYKYIPPHLRDFVSRHIHGYEEDLTYQDNEVNMYLVVQGIEFFGKVSSSRGEKYLELTDFLCEPSKIVESISSAPINELNSLKEKLLQEIKKEGYDLKFSHSADIYDNYYSLIVPISEFNEEKLYKSINLWSSYNSKVQEIIETIEN